MVLKFIPTNTLEITLSVSNPKSRIQSLRCFVFLLLSRMYIFGGWVPHKGENTENSPHDCEWRCTSSFSYLNLGES